MYQVIIVVHVLLGLGIIGLILMQQGKGADAGAAFGSGGGSGSVFGAQGSASFLSRTTAIFATLFFTTSLTLAVLGGQQSKKTTDLMDSVEVEQKSSDVPLPNKTVKPENTVIPSTDIPITNNPAPTVSSSTITNVPTTVHKSEANLTKAAPVVFEKPVSTSTQVEKKHQAAKNKVVDKSEKKKATKKAENKHKSEKSHKTDKHD